jgi:dihydrofolate synthase/folylpolyglutamate synthase
MAQMATTRGRRRRKILTKCTLDPQSDNRKRTAQTRACSEPVRGSLDLSPVPPSTEKQLASLHAIEAELFARWGEGRMEPTTERIAALLGLLGDPQRAYRSFHLTGTNGKTSTARMIDQLIRALGLRSGRYTSPHLSSVTERIVLDGEPISADVFIDTYKELAPYLELVDGQFDIRLSFFEVITAMAYAAFADAPVDVAVVEVGLGGEWDATNQIEAEVAVITPIGLDHTEFLGDTIAEIAAEKAGIIKPNSSVILAAQPLEAAEQLLRKAVEVGAVVAREGLEFGVIQRQVAVGGQLLTIQGLAGVYDEIFLPLFGEYQAQNAACALAAVEAFFGADKNTGPIDLESVRAAFAQVRAPGRLETVRSSPTILADATHNPAGMRATVAALADGFDFQRLIAVVGVLQGKDARTMLELLEPIADELIVTESSSSRRMPVDDLAAIAVDIFGVDRVTVEPHLDDAIDASIRLAEEDADGLLSGVGVLITGSVVTAGEARDLLVGKRR